MAGISNFLNKTKWLNVTVLKYQHADLSRLSTMALSGYAEELWQISESADLPRVIPQLAGTDFSVLGGGSNSLFVGDYLGILLQLTDDRLEVIEQKVDHVLVKVAAGMNWHAFVCYCLQQGWFGVENLAAIPGTVGAAPIQNIGAYGVECAHALHSVDVIDLQTGNCAVWSTVYCQLSYRDSIFKRSEIKNRWLITAVTWRLSLHWEAQLHYPDLQVLREIASLTVQQVFAKVCEIRASKLPDPSMLPNVGSFFKNPIIPLAQWQTLQQRYTNMRGFVVNDQQMKVAAAWMIDHCGWKGRRCGAVGVHREQALVLINFGGGDARQLLKLAHEIQMSVWEIFQIWLLPEPVLIGDEKLWQHLLQPPS